MRCDQCNKFVSYDDSNDPEVNDVSLDGTEVTADVRIVLPCVECGQELKGANLNPTANADVAEHKIPEGEEDEHELEVEDNGDASLEVRTEGKGRYMKTFYGARLTARVYCSGCDFETEVELYDEVQASDMEELI